MWRGWHGEMVLLATVFDPIAWTGFEKSLRGFVAMKWLFGASWRADSCGELEIFLVPKMVQGAQFILHLYILRTDLLRFLLTWVALENYGIRVSWFMNEKILIIALLTILGIGFVGIMFVVFPWVFSSGFSNWKQMLIDDGLIIVCLIMFVYGFYMNTRMHWINIVLGWTSCHVSQWKFFWIPYFSVEQPK